MKSSRVFIALAIALGGLCGGVIFLLQIHAVGESAPQLTVTAVAHQWWWEFDYPSLGIKTSDVLYVPIATNIRVELASADVIHSFWLIGMKKSVDIIPRKTGTLDLVVKSPGELYGNCDAACGCAAGCMRFQVLASTPGNFQKWVARERLSGIAFKPPHQRDAPACVEYRPRRPPHAQFSRHSFAALTGWRRGSHTRVPLDQLI